MPDKLPVFDFSEALKTCYGKYHLFQDMVDCFFQESDPMLGRMQTALGQRDNNGMAYLAHRLLNTIAYLGSVPATEKTRRLEHAARANDLETCSALFCDLLGQLEALKAALLPHRHHHSSCPCQLGASEAG